MNDELTKKVLLRSAELVERGWCQGSLGVRHQLMRGEQEICRQFVVSHPQGLLQADRVCLDGALMLATHEVTGEDLDQLGRGPLYHAVQVAIKAHVARDHASPSVDWPDVGLTSYVSWNDVPGRTAAEVAALCRKAAE